MAAATAIATCYLDLDPTYTDRLRPQADAHHLRFPRQRTQDVAIPDGPARPRSCRRWGRAQLEKNPRAGHYDVTEYQTTHTCGGAIMGADPKTSAVNRYLQSWDVPNLFVTGATAFPQNAGYNPTDTVGALAYWAADAIRNQYLKNPGPLVQA